MPLVEYSDSEPEEDDSSHAQSEPVPSASKKPENSDVSSKLPPLPQSFRDLYSSTVRTSTQDDPSLHGGRKRVTPHVPGNWPSHVYLEWCPSPEESKPLTQLIGAQSESGKQGEAGNNDIRSLLQNDLGVALPLHVSLSRPLVLKTEQKDDFFLALKDAISDSGVKAFKASLKELQWHPNEDRTRWFLVLRVEDEDDELLKLLRVCNAVAKRYNQPSLYEDDVQEEPAREIDGATKHDQNPRISKKFHISIAWSLAEHHSSPDSGPNEATEKKTGSSKALLEPVSNFSVLFGEVKVRIGQDVTSLPLSRKRRRISGMLS